MNGNEPEPVRRIASDDWTLFILAGGRSKRMGRDKSQIEVDGVSLLTRVQRVAASCVPRSETLRSDAIANCGPLSGIYTGLLRTQTPWCLFLACDMPLLSRETVFEIMKQTGRAATAVFTRTTHGFGFPLTLHKDQHAALGILIDEGNRSLHALAEHVRPEPFTLTGDRRHELFNANTPSDLQQLTKMISPGRAQ